MNKRMREILTKMGALKNEAKAFKDEKKFDDAKAKITEIAQLQKEFEIEKALYETEKDKVPDEVTPTTKKTKTNGFTVITKMLKKNPLSETEKALVTNGESGENNIIPEDVDTKIRELRGEFKSAKDLCTVIPTKAISGSFTFEDTSTITGLTDFTDGDNIDESSKPKFKLGKFTIKLLGKIIPVSNVLKDTEQGGLLVYIRNWFVKNAVLSENKKIFDELKKDKDERVLNGWRGLKSSINLDLKSSSKIDGVIITNQTGFDILDSAVDENGRPILKSNPKDETERLFKGLKIEVFDDEELPNMEGKSPIFYGSIKAGIYFIELKGLQFAVSEHAGFNTNQTKFRVIEGIDVIGADKGAYEYGLLTRETAPLKTMSFNSENEVPTQPKLIGQMKKDELVAYAKDRGIDISSATTKEEILNVIKTAEEQ